MDDIANTVDESPKTIWMMMTMMTMVLPLASRRVWEGRWRATEMAEAPMVTTVMTAERTERKGRRRLQKGLEGREEVTLVIEIMTRPPSSELIMTVL